MTTYLQLQKAREYVSRLKGAEHDYGMRYIRALCSPDPEPWAVPKTGLSQVTACFIRSQIEVILNV